MKCVYTILLIVRNGKRKQNTSRQANNDFVCVFEWGEWVKGGGQNAEQKRNVSVVKYSRLTIPQNKQAT